MPYVKFVNEANGVSYDTETELYNIIYYICNPIKTTYDEIRPGHMLGDFAGAAHFFGDEAQQLDPSCVAEQMIVNNKCYGKSSGNLIKHRIISFGEYDEVMPDEAYQLGRYIANVYGKDYITCFGVHVDGKNIHIHIAVNTIGWRDGNRFSISYEYKWIYGMVSSWMCNHTDNLINNPKSRVKHEHYFGY